MARFRLARKHDKLSRDIRLRHDMTYNRSVSASKASASMRSHLPALVAMIPRESPEDQEHVESLLRACEDGIDAQEAANASLLALIPPSSRKSPRASDIADQTFALPEILEHVLSYLPSADVLSAHRVNRTFHGTIEGSIKLQRALGLRVDPHARFSMPACDLLRQSDGIHMPGLDWWPTYIEKGAKADEIGVRIETLSSSKFSPMKLGSRCANMLLVQPPIKSMEVYTHCCNRPPSPFRIRRASQSAPTITISSPTGITVGEILDALSRMRAEHSLCLQAHGRDHDKDGFVRSKITIKGTLVLNSDDPVVHDRRRGLRKVELKTQRDQLRKNKLRMYVAAKIAAHRSGNAIPTMAEFEATQPQQQAGVEEEDELDRDEDEDED